MLPMSVPGPKGQLIGYPLISGNVVHIAVTLVDDDLKMTTCLSFKRRPSRADIQQANQAANSLSERFMESFVGITRSDNRSRPSIPRPESPV